MKKLILIIGLILLIANGLFGLILSVYPSFNFCVTSGVIVATTALLYVMRCINLRDAFYISLSLLFVLFGFIEFVLGLFAQDTVKDNWYLIIIILLCMFEAILLAITHRVSDKI